MENEFPNCDIDFCAEDGSQTLLVEIPTGNLEFFFCPTHAKALNERMAQQLGAKTYSLDLYKDKIPYTTKDLREALSYLDGLAAMAEA